ncbi:Transcriptional regulator, AbiEi antitoxin, Type IV TA system [Pelagirhabdus alkalitolerans]|uniref:Transcriptional regulator, AbiEi antitoxin, Type IV TA system n=2 Tax=Pelagirhabdus alkalitolerans TaxID=1612202 RepID=A0A1G6MYB2_9BACI|nr:Transcriptional regulator, AbiEi antitoxin, Type IV TA system [Pelagirhabdus alkalitolerans]
MPRLNRFQIMGLYKNEIKHVLENHQKILFTEKDLYRIFENNRNDWKLPRSTKMDDFLSFLSKQNIITRSITLDFPKGTFKRYVYNQTHSDIDALTVVRSLYDNGYFSHNTAAFLHGLTQNIVKTIYFNKELTPKNSEISQLKQDNIDRAFSKEARASQNISYFDGQQIVLLNSKFTNNLGVTELGDNPVTNIEKTLIDIAVRPHYAGGSFEVLNMYKNAKGVASVNKIYSYLKKIQYIYPYHQVIGFYLERAGFKDTAVKLMERFPINYHFYLRHNMKNMSFSDRWNLYYPEEFDA